jgi:hypothetical protein
MKDEQYLEPTVEVAGGNEPSSEPVIICVSGC